jgi:ribosomal protein S18 acetylase RimI-like enzyme
MKETLMSTNAHTVVLRRATPGDVDLLRQVGIRTFTETFEALNSPENMKHCLDKAFAESQLLHELMNRESEFWFAVLGSEVVGYLKINRGQAQTEKQHDQAVEIERIYVLAEYHGTGVAQKLFQKAMECAHEQQAPYVWLGVWENNAKAIRFYEKYGFVKFGHHAFWLGDDEQTDILMKLSLNY